MENDTSLACLKERYLELEGSMVALSDLVIQITNFVGYPVQERTSTSLPCEGNTIEPMEESNIETQVESFTSASTRL